jgi:hypothetical protein
MNGHCPQSGIKLRLAFMKCDEWDSQKSMEEERVRKR